MDYVDYICFGIIGFLLFICIISFLYECIPECMPDCIKWFTNNTKDTKDKTKVTPFI